MARELDTDHSEVEVSRADIAELFPTAIRHIERPILRTAAAPMLLLARQAGLVVTSGEQLLALVDELLAQAPRADAPGGVPGEGESPLA